MILYVIFETARNGGLFCVQKNMREITGTGEFFERGTFRLNGKRENYYFAVHELALFSDVYIIASLPDMTISIVDASRVIRIHIPVPLINGTVPFVGGFKSHPQPL